MVRSISITFSGVNMCLEPSMCERNSTPSSRILRMPDKEKTWKPPLSVSMGRSKPLNLCKPPARSMISSPGRRYKWYVFPNMICALISSFNSCKCTPFTVPNVPTGMKIGVSICPWSVVMIPARALDLGSVYCKSKVILFLFFVCLISNIKVYGTVYFFISQSKLQHLFNVIYIVES